MAQAGDDVALGEVIEAHRGQVRGECWRLRVQRADLEDYVQEGLAAMLEPIRRFDRDRGVPLWLYARWYVRLSVVKGLGRSIDLTAHQASWYSRVWSAFVALGGEAASPTAEAVRAHVVRHRRRSVSVASVRAILDAGRRRHVPFEEGRDAPVVEE